MTFKEYYCKRTCISAEDLPEWLASDQSASVRANSNSYAYSIMEEAWNAALESVGRPVAPEPNKTD